MRRRLRAAAEQAGDTLPDDDCLSVMIHRWEDNRSGISERYRMHFCKAFQLPLDEFGSLRARSEPPGGQVSVPAAPPSTTTRPAERPDPAGLGRSWIEQEILTAAHESSNHAQHTERRDAGEATLEHLRAEVTRLSHDGLTAEPLTLFFEMRQVRDQIHAALDRKLWPKDQTDLHFLLGCLNHLMACTADSLGNSPAAEQLARAGLAYAQAIDHPPLTAQLRLGLAVIALYAGQPNRSLDQAARGLDHLRHGPNCAQLKLLQARAAARLGDSTTVKEAIATATEIRDRDTGYSDDVIDIGGDLGFSRASHHYYAGSAIADLAGAENDAIAELSRALDLYAAGPEPGEHHSLTCTILTRINLAGTLLQAGQLEAAASVLEPVLAMPFSQRNSRITKRLSHVRSVLATCRYQHSPEAQDFDRCIEQFCRDAIVTQIHNLPDGIGRVTRG